MAEVKPYLTFHGNCQEALRHYHQCLGGTLRILTLGATDRGAALPASLHDKVVEGSLSTRGFTIMGTDMVGEQGLAHGNAVTLFLDCADEQEVQSLFEALSTGGAVSQPLELDHQLNWGAALTDRYGVHWMLRATAHREP